MSENEGIRIVSLFVGILLCTALMQTACAAWTANWNEDTGNVTMWNATTENKTVTSTIWSSTDGSLPTSDVINTPIQSPNAANAPKFSDFVSGSILRNGIQFPRVQKL